MDKEEFDLDGFEELVNKYDLGECHHYQQTSSRLHKISFGAEGEFAIANLEEHDAIALTSLLRHALPRLIRYAKTVRDYASEKPQDYDGEHIEL